MKYFLDFDRTIFDTDAFKRSLHERPTLLELMREGKLAVQEFFASEHTTRRRLFLADLGTFASHGRFMFSAEELETFLYPDAKEFLRSHDCTIVTYGVRAFITAKVTTALTEYPQLDIVYTSRKKGRTIKRLIKENPGKGPFIFVDDMAFQLESVQKWCPEVEVVQILRIDPQGTRKEAGGTWCTIATFKEIA